MNLKDFNFKIDGPSSNAPWIIFLHGLLGSLHNWGRIKRDFEGSFRILTFDQRGHGKSLHPTTGYSPQDFAKDIKFLMDELKIPSAHVVGHSMGARNAMAFAHLFPDRITKLVVEDIGPGESIENGSALVKKLRAVPVPFTDKGKAKEYLIKNFSDPKLAQFIYTNISTDSKGRAVWRFDLEAVAEILEKGRGKGRWEEFKQITCPILVVRGEHSNELSTEEFERMKACNPKVRGVQILNAGHWVHFDRPEEFVGLVAKFLGET